MNSDEVLLLPLLFAIAFQDVVHVHRAYSRLLLPHNSPPEHHHSTPPSPLITTSRRPSPYLRSRIVDLVVPYPAVCREIDSPYACPTDLVRIMVPVSEYQLSSSSIVLVQVANLVTA